MGSNMMRQAVPLMITDSPIVGTGLEPHVAKDSRTLINAEGDGIVTYVDATKISIKYNYSKEEKLINFEEDEKPLQLDIEEVKNEKKEEEPLILEDVQCCTTH